MKVFIQIYKINKKYKNKNIKCFKLMLILNRIKYLTTFGLYIQFSIIAKIIWIKLLGTLKY